ncbi:MAG: 16S rRNA (cytosine(1402)-N(4))-methyltransferase RsmH [Pseudomonadota bacterium]
MTRGSSGHRPVLLEEALAALAVHEGGIYLDATFGRGGHSEAILKCLGAAGRLVALDHDADAVAAGRVRFKGDERFHMVHASFGQLAAVARQEGIAGAVDGLLLDLGVSSPQLDEAHRGFSFLRNGPLDMRMDQRQTLTAASWLSSATENEIRDVLRRYGEERYAGRIARAIVARRREAPLRTTAELAALIAEVNPAWEAHKHPATRSFQAIRMRINDEPGELRRCLSQALEVLRPGGRLAVISFHSVEDRVVKRFIQEQARGDDFPKGVPVPAAQLRPRLKAVGKSLTPGAKELEDNPRARSARLRVAERLA